MSNRILVKEGSAVYGWYINKSIKEVDIYTYSNGFVGTFDKFKIRNIESFVKEVANKAIYDNEINKIRLTPFNIEEGITT